MAQRDGGNSLSWVCSSTSHNGPEDWSKREDDWSRQVTDMGFKNISADNLYLAATGMTVVFAALTMISVFIYLLPQVLSVVEVADPPAPAGSSPAANDDEEVAAAIGFAVHYHQTQSARQSGL